MQKYEGAMKRLRHYRATHGLKQRDLAHVLGVDQTTVSRWESGVSTPTLAQYGRIRSLLWKSPTFSFGALKATVAHSPVARSVVTGHHLNFTAYSSMIDAHLHGVAEKLVGQECLSMLGPEYRDHHERSFQTGAVRDLMFIEAVERVVISPTGEGTVFRKRLTTLLWDDGLLIADNLLKFLTEDEFLAIGPSYREVTHDEI